MINGLDIHYSKNIGQGLKLVSTNKKVSGSGLKPISTNKKVSGNCYVSCEYIIIIYSM